MGLLDEINVIINETDEFNKGDVIKSLFQIINLLLFSFSNIFKK